MEHNHFDCIVIGFGGVGSAAMRYAALNGWKVLGIDRFGPAHNRGSSHGQTRVIRKSYFEHPNYVPLLQEAYERWDELNKRHRTAPEVKELLTQCGVLQVGPGDGTVVNGVLKSAQEHGVRGGDDQTSLGRRRNYRIWRPHRSMERGRRRNCSRQIGTGFMVG